MAYFLSPALVKLRAEVNALWPHRDKTSDGWIGDTSHQARPSDHNPDWSDGGIVRAIDLDEDLVTGLTATGEAMPLVNQIIRDSRTGYVIYEGRIWTSSSRQWRTYTGVNAHRHHIHISVSRQGTRDRDARPWGLAGLASNPVGGGGSVGVPNVPGAPAPITKGFLMTLSDAEQQRLLERVDNLYQAMFYGSLAGGVQYPGLLAIEAETQKRVTETPAKAAAHVWATNVKRTDGHVSALQELADAKTLAMQAQGKNAGLRAALDALAKGQALTPEQIQDAARKGAEDALKGGVKVTIDIPQEDA